MITLYGIKNCDTVKKARKFLQQQQVAYQFHDYRADGISAELVAQFSAGLGWQNILNTRGTTWRQLTEEQKQHIEQQGACALMLQYPALIKRPILVDGTKFILGFSESEYQKLVTVV